MELTTMFLLLMLYVPLVVGALLCMAVALILWWSLIPTTKSLRRGRLVVVSARELTDSVVGGGHHHPTEKVYGTPGNRDVTTHSGQIPNSDLEPRPITPIGGTITISVGPPEKIPEPKSSE